ncbi:hypothetical protein [uncultured Fibrella sp.]|uniref:hypothetical protein n=1 Tax=uncultured Fibrella sp. TaxID=1284596 RepID=UPI0035CC279F
MKQKLTPRDYAHKVTQLQQVVDDCPKLTADRTRWDLDGSWEGVTVHFIDTRERAKFAPWRDFDCKTIKLVNYDTPAVRIAFFPKHKYWVLKDGDLTNVDKQQRLHQLIGSIELRLARLETQLDHTDPPPLTLFGNDIAPGKQLTSSSTRIRQLMEELINEKKGWLTILNDIASYELAFSTYRRGYTYLYIHWKYKLPSGEFDRANEHLLNNKRDKLGNINQIKHNVVFIDTEEIFRPHPFQNKEVELFLKKFPIRSSQAVPDVYARRRPDIDNLDQFK